MITEPVPYDQALYDWVFHLNTYTGEFAAIPRELYTDYWNDHQLEGILRSTSISTLLELLHKSKGEPGTLKI